MSKKYAPLEIGLSRRTMLAALIAIREKGEGFDPDQGIEGNITYLLRNKIARTYIAQATQWYINTAKTWPKFSGDYRWPVPSPNKNFSPESYALRPYAHGDGLHWEGKYGESQMELLNFLIETIEGFTSDNDFGIAWPWNDPTATKACEAWFSQVNSRLVRREYSGFLENDNLGNIPGGCRSALDFVLRTKRKTLTDITSVGVYPMSDLLGYGLDDSAFNFSCPIAVFFAMWQIVTDAEELLRKRNEIFVLEKNQVMPIADRVEFLFHHIAAVRPVPERKLNSLKKRYIAAINIMKDLDKARPHIFHDIMALSPNGGRNAVMSITQRFGTRREITVFSGVDIPNFGE